MKKLIEWMVYNHVTANLIMIFLLLGGLYFSLNMKQEIFPETELDKIIVTTSYPGASPFEVEQGILLPIEEAVDGLVGIKEIHSKAKEGVGVVTLSVEEDENVDLILQEVKNEIDRITNFPKDAEQPEVEKLKRKWHVINVVIYGDLNDLELREQTEEIRDELLQKDEISQIDYLGTKPYEISIEVNENELKKHGLTLSEISSIVSADSIDIPGGNLKEPSGDFLLRVKEKKQYASEFKDIVIKSNQGGELLKLGDIAVIKDTFEDNDSKAYYDGKNALGLIVYRVGDQTPLKVSRTVRRYLKEKRLSLPDHVKLDTYDDRSELLVSRMNLLKKNAVFGLIFVFCSLLFFLELRLAFWVTIGIPVSFLGTFMLMPMFDLSINMISLFAFILALGIVVDDAIVVGENIFVHKKKMNDPLKAAIKGTSEVSVPVFFTVLTTIVTFMPLFFVSGTMGKFIWAIPAVVISVLAISLLESLLILPVHIAHSKKNNRSSNNHREFLQQKIDYFIQIIFKSIVKNCFRYKYICVAVSIFVLIVTIGLFSGGLIKFTFFPKVESYVIACFVELPFGSPVHETEKVTQLVTHKLYETNKVLSEKEGKELLKNIVTIINYGEGPHMSQITAVLLSPEDRQTTLREFTNLWRKESVKEFEGDVKASFSYSHRQGGEDINLALSHRNLDALEQAAKETENMIMSYQGVYDVENNMKNGKREIIFTLSEKAKNYGITSFQLGTELRARYRGLESYRFLRGKSEVKVMVRIPKTQRLSLSDLDQIKIRTNQGIEIPLKEAAHIEYKKGYSVINRHQTRRVINITASVDQIVQNTEEVTEDLKNNYIQELKNKYPGLIVFFEGRAKDRNESLGTLFRGFGFALFAIFALLAILFGSYSQPLLVMFAIPFGIVGAAIGHYVMGYDLSIISTFGIVALSGVVVNDSLILISFINIHRKEDDCIFNVCVNASLKRFRPIILTSITTFCGLMPMILETSMQARFLIPMAISLGFGVLFATVITLIIIPCFYLILEDMKCMVRFLWQKL